MHTQIRFSTDCVYASWEEYGSCAGYDYIMEKVVKTTSIAFHGAAIKGSCDDDQSKAISGEIRAFRTSVQEDSSYRLSSSCIGGRVL
jgi:hypothetical protein